MLGPFLGPLCGPLCVKNERYQLLEVMSDFGAECMASYDKTNAKHTSNAVLAARIARTALSVSSHFIR